MIGRGGSVNAQKNAEIIGKALEVGTFAAARSLPTGDEILSGQCHAHQMVRPKYGAAGSRSAIAGNGGFVQGFSCSAFTTATPCGPIAIRPAARSRASASQARVAPQPMRLAIAP